MMRAKLRNDLVDLVREKQKQVREKKNFWNFNFGNDILPLSIAEMYAGKTLQVENVTKSDVTLRLRGPWWITGGAITTGLTLIAVPHAWLEKDITKEQFVDSSGVVL